MMRSRKMAFAGIALVIGVAIGAFWSFFLTGDQDQDVVNPASLRRYWEGEEAPPVAAYVLTANARTAFQGTFGVDLSHYTFDRDPKNKKCRSADGYLDPACSCTINLQAVIDSGIRYVYAKATDGATPDLSFARLWAELKPKHETKSLFRGAYHFLRPGIDPNKQADVFLNAIGATNGQKPNQLSPVLDIE